jgi:signal transduction histidine kinase
MGLALSRRLARDLGGELLLAETNPHGARFVLTLKVVASSV